MSKTTNSALARIYVFLLYVSPMLIWLGTDKRLHHIGEAVGYTILIACLASSAPRRSIRYSVVIYILFLPLTLVWVAAVSLTGLGLSISSAESLIQGAYAEVMSAGLQAIKSPGFLLVSVVIISLLTRANRATKNTDFANEKIPPFVFMAALVALTPITLSGAEYAFIDHDLNSESKVSIVWVNEISAAKELLDRMLFFDDCSLCEAESISIKKMRYVGSAAANFSLKTKLAVFIVGDSLRVDALPPYANGPWSDLLKYRLENNLGARFPNVCAGANNTFASIPKLFTASASADPSEGRDKETILALAKRAGALTAYINNHETWILPEGGHDLNVKLSSWYSRVFDESAIETLSDFVRINNEKSLAAIVHLYGQHFDYKDRYPRKLFNKEPSGMAGADLLNIQYQRSAEYGTKVLLGAADIIDSLDSPSFIIYTSDHGENLPRDNTGRMLHGGPSNSLKDTIVPAVILWNKAFRDSGLIEQILPILQSENTIAHRDLAISWLALIGAPVSAYPTKNPLSWGALNLGDKPGVISCANLHD